MKRLFDEHERREVHRLDGLWDFAADRAGEGRRRGWARTFPAATERMAVPGCWDAKPEYFHYHGAGYYRRHITLPRRSHALITFEGVSGRATVFFDGRKVGEHSGTFTPFETLVRNCPAGEHELVVRVDNDHSGLAVLPQYPCDWFHYGGIVRPVELALLGDVWIRGLRIAATFRGAMVQPRVELEIANLSRRARREMCTIELDGRPAAFPIELPAGATVRVERPLAAARLERWSPASPRLYTVRVTCGGDDLIDRTGFREVRARSGKIFLNGEPIKILGVCRHHETPDCGFAVPPALVLRDFEIIRDLGANAVRCHYPIDALAMDLCDEMGLLFWEECPFYARWPEVVGHRRYLALAERTLEEMIRRDWNRPSVVIWSVLNESSTATLPGARAAARLVRKVRTLDDTRLVGYASNTALRDRGFRFLDVIGVNSYPGWYESRDFPDWPAMMTGLRRKLRREGLAGTPVLVTETGAAGLYGDRALETRKWSEDYQAENLRRSLEYLLSEDAVAGVFIWQLCDIRTANAYWTNRPGTFNNKGLLDRFRRPKQAYGLVRELYRAAGCAKARPAGS